MNCRNHDRRLEANKSARFDERKGRKCGIIHVGSNFRFGLDRFCLAFKMSHGRLGPLALASGSALFSFFFFGATQRCDLVPKLANLLLHLERPGGDEEKTHGKKAQK